MSVLELIKKRRSIRRFQEKQIPDEYIDKFIEALIWAPSGGNLQPRKFFFVTNPDVKKSLASAAHDQKFIADAPLAIVCCADIEKGAPRYGDRGVHLYALQDVAASAQSLMLLCTELGLGTVWVGAFDEIKVQIILSLPKNLRPVTIIPVGYPAKTPDPTPRVSKDEAVVFVK